MKTPGNITRNNLIKSAIICSLVSFSCNYHPAFSQQYHAPEKPVSILVQPDNEIENSQFLKKFWVVLAEGTVYVNWIQKGNTEDCLYVIEKSSDTNLFAPMGHKTGMHAPVDLLYGFIDSNPLEGYNYYRLKVIGETEETHYSQVMMIYHTPDNSVQRLLTSAIHY